MKVLPSTANDPLNNCDVTRLTAVTGYTNKSYGKRILRLDFSSVFWWHFLIAGVEEAIFGAHFLSANNLIVDLKGRLSFTFEHDPFTIEHDPFTIEHDPFTIEHDPFTIEHDPFTFEHP
ncbi:hypothetical protein RF11_09571 [Thelohanellus kitauei]|uniref:Uncharacterized protein n=1 Tax=Thelohanellus kitauei TaxID=669202 RepID=A0A0C2MMD7_THEKT|nr:hypothetical protein RF11_09571 [Thelohanellus kitauei]